MFLGIDRRWDCNDEDIGIFQLFDVGRQNQIRFSQRRAVNLAGSVLACLRYRDTTGIDIKAGDRQVTGEADSEG